MIEAIGQTGKLLSEAQRLSARAEGAAAAYHLALWPSAVAVGAMALDVVLPLPGALRGLILVGVLLGTALGAITLRRRAGATVPLERAARLIEARTPALDNALINSVQFGERIRQAPDPDSAALMREEIRRGERESAHLSPEQAADLNAVRAGRRRLAWLAGGVLITAVLFPRAWRFEIPRFGAFWADHPPFTLTDFHVTPGSIHVRRGASVTVTVRMGGFAPDSVSLVTGTSSHANEPAPLYADEGGRYTLTLENLSQDTWYYARASTGRSDRYAISIDQAPRVKALTATLHPPAYTGRGPQAGSVGAEGISGLAGTVVDLQVTSNRDLSRGALRLGLGDGPEETLPLTLVPGHADQCRATFTLRRSGRFAVDLWAADGQGTREAAHGPIHLALGEKPVVYLTQPGGNAMVTPNMAVPIQAEAEHEIGVAKLELHRVIDNMAESAVALPVSPGQHVAAGATLDLKDLGVRPGDVIQYYATAFDTTPGKPSMADSERNWLWVVSDEDYRKALEHQRGLPQMAEEYRGLTEALKALSAEERALADRAEELRKQNPTGQKERETIQGAQRQLAQKARDLARDMRNLAARKPQYDIEKGFQAKLRQLAAGVERAMNRMALSAAAPRTAEAARLAESAARELESAAGESKRSIEKALAALEKLAPLYQDIALLKQLAESQAQAAMQARQLAQQARRDEFVKARTSEIKTLEDQSREGIEQLVDALAEDAKAVVDSEPEAAKEGRLLSKALSASGAGPLTQSAAEALSRVDLPAGAENAERARRALESLFKQGNQAGNRLSQGLDSLSRSALGMGAGDTLNQVSRAGQPGNGPGLGGGTAQGEEPAPTPGSRPGVGSNQGGGSARRVMAFVPRSQAGSRPTRRKHPAQGGAPLADLSEESVERLAEPARIPSPVRNSDEGRYPAEYRRLVKDYFRAVAAGK